MQYISKALSATLSKPSILLLFILVNMIEFPRFIAEEFRIIDGWVEFFVSISLTVVVVYLKAGVYSLAWNNFNEKAANLFSESKKYFTKVLILNIFMIIACGVILWPLMMLHNFVFLADVPSEQIGKRFDTILYLNLTLFIVSLLFVYALPAIFIAKQSGKKAIATSWHFFKSNIESSRPVISLLAFSTFISVFGTKLGTIFDYTSSQFWFLSAVKIIIIHAFTFFVFLVASQIFEASYEKEKTI